MVHYTTYKFIRVHVHHKHKKAKSIDKMYIVKHCEGVTKFFFLS